MKALFLTLIFGCLLGGCGQAYTTPGGAADFGRLGLTPEAKAQLTDTSVQKFLDKKPLVTFPATIAFFSFSGTPANCSSTNSNDFGQRVTMCGKSVANMMWSTPM